MIGQLDIALNNSLLSILLSDSQVSRMEDGKGCKIIELRTLELRSEKELPDPHEVPKLESKEENGDQCT